MSIDLSQGAPLSTDPTIRDLIIVYGGWQASWDPLTSGSPLPDDGSGTAVLIQQLQGITPAPFHKILILAMSGSLPSKLGVLKGLNFIIMNFHPQGSLIIYGYSAGGTDALTLCREIDKQISAFGLSSGQLENKATATALKNQGVEDFADVRVDLLITVDAAAGPASGAVNRVVSPCVLSNLNFFQTTASAILSRGGPNQAADNTRTNIDNEDLTGQAVHSTIDEFTNDSVVQAIQGQLGVVAMPSAAPPDTGFG